MSILCIIRFLWPKYKTEIEIELNFTFLSDVETNLKASQINQRAGADRINSFTLVNRPNSKLKPTGYSPETGTTSPLTILTRSYACNLIYRRDPVAYTIKIF